MRKKKMKRCLPPLALRKGLVQPPQLLFPPRKRKDARGAVGQPAEPGWCSSHRARSYAERPRASHQEENAATRHEVVCEKLFKSSKGLVP